MAIVKVNHTTQTLAAGTSTSVTLGWTTTVGNCLVVVVYARSNSTSVTVTGTGASFTQHFIKEPSAGNSRCAYQSAVNIGSAISSITVASSASCVKSVTVIEFSGVATASEVDVTNWLQQTGATQDSYQMVTTNANDVVIGSTGNAGNTGTTYASAGPSAASGSSGTWTDIGNISNSGGNNGSIGHAIAYQIVSSTGTYQAEWTALTSAGSVGGGLALKAAVTTTTDMKWNRDTNQPLFDKIGVISYLRLLINAFVRLWQT